LPDGRGIDFVNAIKPSYPSLKIIMITAHDTPGDRAKAYGNGVNFFLSKPFTLAEINKAVEFVMHGN
jgi:DNA-binding NarL/FixJ family response regulator